MSATATVVPAVQGTAAPVKAAIVGCFHCGLPCGSAPIVEEDKPFCCHGCASVHALLNASGLGRFYELQAHPGSKVARVARQEQWGFLDDPAVQQPLLDFTDGRTSRVTFQMPAIHCVACVWLLENLFRLHPGVGASRVNFARREVAIVFAPEQLKLSELVALLASIGYEPRLTLGESNKNQTEPARRRLHLQIGVAGFAFGNIMLFALPAYLGYDSVSAPMFRALFGGLSLALALPVIAFSAADYFRSAWLSFRQRVLTLDVPIAAGLVAIYGQSVFEILTGRGEGYLDSMTGLVFFLLSGKIFQQKTYDRLAFDRDYKCFFPLSVRRRKEGREESAALSTLAVGDQLLLRNGELIPADARLISGPAFVDYSFVTGEADPMARQPGDYLYAGGRQVGGTIEIETVKPVSQSYLTSLWNHEAFQKPRLDDLQTLTNLYSRRFTLIVIGVALAALTGWALAGNAPRGVQAFISVLIVACPCALALAAPFTLGTAQRLLARSRMFLKNTRVLERLARVNALVLDKTGTLTTAGVAGVTFQPAGAPLSSTEEGLVFSLSRHSTHPQSVRISDSLGTSHFPEPVRGFLETAGCGIEGSVRGHEVWLGSRAWLESRHASCGPRRDDDSGERASEVWLAIDGMCRGAYRLTSSLRPGVAELASRLGGRHEITLLSGDNDRDQERFRRVLGERAGLHFQQSPLDKLNHVRRLQQNGRCVMMVGDGLNDAGALKQSDVGVAVVEQAGAFTPASDLIIEAPQVARLADLLSFGRDTTRVVRWCFLLSTAYNAVGIGIAASGLLSPLVCAVLMPISSASVVALATGGAHWAARRNGLQGGKNSSNPPPPAGTQGESFS